MILEPTVTPIAMTDILKVTDDRDIIDELGLPENDVTSKGERLIEYAGRSCYRSFHRPRPETAETDAYVRNLIAQGHESVLDHVSVTFRVEGVSRNLLIELTRHRHLSFSVISTRFVDSSDGDFVLPPAVRDYGSGALKGVWEDMFQHSIWVYQQTVSEMENAGLTRKQAREAAAGILPGALETELEITGNLRAWRDVLKKRYSPHANAEIRDWAHETLAWLDAFYPSVFDDFTEPVDG